MLGFKTKNREKSHSLHLGAAGVLISQVRHPSIQDWLVYLDKIKMRYIRYIRGAFCIIKFVVQN